MGINQLSTRVAHKPKIPLKSALEAEYAKLSSLTELGALYGVSQSTVRRWFTALGIQARPIGAAIDPARRRGGRTYKKTGKKPQHVTVEQAYKMRELRRDQPELTLMEIAKAAGSKCSKQMVLYILQGKRVTAPEAFPPEKAPARLKFRGVSKK
jgi:transposase